MLNIESILEDRFPDLSKKTLISKTLVPFLKAIFHEQEFQQFSKDYPYLQGLDFVEKVLEYFQFSYSIRNTEIERIPKSGRVVIYANHPIGTLDGMALLKLVSEVRKDVKAMGNDYLMNIKPLNSCLLPVDNMGGSTRKKNLQAIKQFLDNEGALIVFPAGEVSRMSPAGIKDGLWRSGFYKIAHSTQSPLLPIHIDARNSFFFYGLSILSKPLSTLWLIHEMFKHNQNSVSIRIGEAISPDSYSRSNVDIKSKVKLLKKHLYRVGKDKSPYFHTEKAIAHPEDRQRLKQCLRDGKLLGETKDGKRIYLCQYQHDSALMKEIGRLRELSFRTVGEGTGTRRDIDRYDERYMHLVLWDENDLEIVGAYRLADTKKLVDQYGLESLYTHELFQYKEGILPYLNNGLEVGRSFVQPRYWGKRSLDYLWFGIGAVLRENPDYRYLFGPVSLSNSYPKRAKDLLVHFYSTHFPSDKGLGKANQPYLVDADTEKELRTLFKAQDYGDDFTILKSQLTHMGLSVPTLYKQYTELCDEGGVQFVDFNIDHDFSDCIDGLVLVDTNKIKAKKRKRYIG